MAAFLFLEVPDYATRKRFFRKITEAPSPEATSSGASLSPIARTSSKNVYMGFLWASNAFTHSPAGTLPPQAVVE